MTGTNLNEVRSEDNLLDGIALIRAWAHRDRDALQTIYRNASPTAYLSVVEMFVGLLSTLCEDPDEFLDEQARMIRTHYRDHGGRR